MWWVLLLLLLMRLVLVHVRTAQYSIDVTCLDYMRWLQRTRSPFDKINANRTRARAHTHNTHVCYNDEHLMKCRMPQLWRVYSMLYVYTTGAIPRQYHFEWAPMNDERRYDDVAKNSIWQHSKHCTSDNRFIRTEYVGDIYANAPFLCAKTQQQQTKNMLSVYCVMVYIKDGKNDSHAKQRVHVCSVRLSCLLLNFCFLPVCAPFE